MSMISKDNNKNDKNDNKNHTAWVIAIVDMSCRFPGQANYIADFWRLSGVHVVSDIHSECLAAYGVRL